MTNQVPHLETIRVSNNNNSINIDEMICLARDINILAFNTAISISVW